MGNADLRDISVIHEVEEDDIAGSTVAVDAPNWLYKYLTTISRFTETEAYTTTEGSELPTLIGVPRGLIRFFEHNIQPVFIFDGEAHSLKADEIASRKEAKQTAAEKAQQAREEGDEIAAAKYESRTQRLTGEVIETTKTLFDTLDVAYMTAPGAAEAQAAHMAKNGDVDYVVSDDYDCLLFGAPKTLRNFTSSSKPLECLDLAATREEHGLTDAQLIDVAILCGTDYNEGVHGVGTKTALSGVAEHGDITGVLDDKDATIENLETVQTILNSPDVTDEVTAPRLPTPDVDAARTYLEETGIDVSKVESALTQISEATSQRGLGEWG